MNYRLFILSFLAIAVCLMSAGVGTADEVNVTFEGHFGGLTYATAVSGNYAYVGQGQDFVVLDISNPSSPSELGMIHTGGIVCDIKISGSYAYVADGSNGLVIVDINNPTAPTLAGSYDTAGNAFGVAVSGSYAYVADYKNGLVIVDISDPAAPTLAGSYDTAGDAYGVAVSGSYAYVANWNDGLLIIDISNPAAPTLAGSYDTAGVACGVAVSGSYTYVADYSNGLVIIDISNPAAPVLAGNFDTARWAYGVAVSGSNAYVADMNNGLVIVDISNPAAPTLVGSYDILGNAQGVAVSGSYAYVADYNNGLVIVDISNPAAPTLAGSYDTTGDARGVALSGIYAYVAGIDSLVLIDISNPAAPTFASSYDTARTARGVAVSGSYAYVADWDNGLVIVDISNPAAPTLTGSYDIAGIAYGVAVSGSYAYVADMNNGLVIVDISNPAAPTLTGSYDTAGYAYGVAVSGSYAYVADDNKGLVIFDISNPTAPTLAGSYDTAGNARGVAVSGSYAYVADDNKGLVIFDISNPTAPTLAGSYDTAGNARGVAVSGSYAYVADGNSGLVIVDISNPAAPTLADSYDTAGYAYGVAVSGSYAYVADGDNGLVILRTDASITNGSVNNTLTVQVYDCANGLMISNASVYLDGNYIDKTDSNGEVSIYHVTTDNHTVKAMKSGFFNESKIVNVSSDKTFALCLDNSTGYPDLTVTNLTISPSFIVKKDIIVLQGKVKNNVTISNIGGNNSTDFGVAFYLDSFDDMIDWQTIDLLPAGSSKNITITWNTPVPEGVHKIYAVVDYKNNVVESNENNNIISNTFILTNKLVGVDVAHPQTVYRHKALEDYEKIPLQFSIKDHNEEIIGNTPVHMTFSVVSDWDFVDETLSRNDILHFLPVNWEQEHKVVIMTRVDELGNGGMVIPSEILDPENGIEKFFIEAKNWISVPTEIDIEIIDTYIEFPQNPLMVSTNMECVAEGNCVDILGSGDVIVSGDLYTDVDLKNVKIIFDPVDFYWPNTDDGYIQCLGDLNGGNSFYPYRFNLKVVNGFKYLDRNDPQKWIERRDDYLKATSPFIYLVFQDENDEYHVTHKRIIAPKTLCEDGSDNCCFYPYNPAGFSHDAYSYALAPRSGWKSVDPYYYYMGEAAAYTLLENGLEEVLKRGGAEKVSHVVGIACTADDAYEYVQTGKTQYFVKTYIGTASFTASSAVAFGFISTGYGAVVGVPLMALSAVGGLYNANSEYNEDFAAYEERIVNENIDNYKNRANSSLIIMKRDWNKFKSINRDFYIVNPNNIDISTMVYGIDSAADPYFTSPEKINPGEQKLIEFDYYDNNIIDYNWGFAVTYPNMDEQLNGRFFSHGNMDNTVILNMNFEKQNENKNEYLTNFELNEELIMNISIAGELYDNSDNKKTLVMEIIEPDGNSETTSYCKCTATNCNRNFEILTDHENRMANYLINYTPTQKGIYYVHTYFGNGLPCNWNFWPWGDATRYRVDQTPPNPHGYFFVVDDTVPTSLQSEAYQAFSIRINSNLTDNSGNPVSDANITGYISRPDGFVETIKLLETVPGYYSVDYENDTLPGNYYIKINTSKEGYYDNFDYLTVHKQNTSSLIIQNVTASEAHVNETLKIKGTVSNNGPDASNVSVLLDMKEVQILNSSHVQLGNVSHNQTKEFELNLQSEFPIVSRPSIAVLVDNETVNTEPIEINILPPIKHGVSLTFNTYAQQIWEGGNCSFILYTKNIGDTNDTFNLSIIEPFGWNINTYYDEFDLQKDQTHKTYITAIPPSNITGTEVGLVNVSIQSMKFPVHESIILGCYAKEYQPIIRFNVHSIEFDANKNQTINFKINAKEIGNKSGAIGLRIKSSNLSSYNNTIPSSAITVENESFNVTKGNSTNISVTIDLQNVEEDKYTGYVGLYLNDSILDSTYIFLNVILDEIPSIISNVTATNITSNSATITWNTNEPCSSLVKYSTESSNFTLKKYSSDYTIFHRITLSGLISDIKYYFIVNSTDQSGNSNESLEHNFSTPLDTTPPASITNLQNTSGPTWINWTWTNPPDSDFNHTELYLNGTVLTNIPAPQNYYNITGLLPDTSYELSTRTIDINGNINLTWINDTASTLPASGTTLSLYTGWNLISLPLMPEDTSITSLLSPINGNYSIVWEYNASDTSDHWKKYDPGAPFGNDLTTMEAGKGYWIMMTSNDTLFVTGDVPGSTDIILKAGWNLIGYNSLDSQPIENALASVSGNYSIVWAYYASDIADHWKKYDPGAPFGNDLANLESGSGYWIMMTSDDILEI